MATHFKLFLLFLISTQIGWSQTPLTFKFCETTYSFNAELVKADTSSYKGTILDILTEYIEITSDSVIYHYVSLSKLTPPENNGHYTRTTIAIKDIKATDINISKTKSGATLWLYHHKNGKNDSILSNLIKVKTYFCHDTKNDIRPSIFIEFESVELAKTYHKKIRKLAGL